MAMDNVYHFGKSSPMISKHNNNLEEIRLRRNLTRQQVADRLGTSVTTVYRKERALRGLKDYEVPEYARAYDCDESEIVGEQPIATTIITHYIGVDGERLPLPDSEVISIKLPWLSSKKMEAAIVRGNDMFPYVQDGSVIFYSREHIGNVPHVKKYAQINYNMPESGVDYSELFGKPCLIHLEDGRIILRELKLGSERDRYNLRRYNAPDLENVKIRTAYKIVFIKTDLADDF